MTICIDIATQNQAKYISAQVAGFTDWTNFMIALNQSIAGHSMKQITSPQSSLQRPDSENTKGVMRVIDKKALYAPERYSAECDRRDITRAIRFWLDIQFGDDYAEATRSLYALGNILKAHDEIIAQHRRDQKRSYFAANREKLCIKEHERYLRSKLSEAAKRRNTKWVFLSDVRNKDAPDEQEERAKEPKRHVKHRYIRIIDDIKAGMPDSEISDKYHTTPDVINVYRIYMDALLKNTGNELMYLEAFHSAVIRGRIGHGGIGIDIYSRDD